MKINKQMPQEIDKLVSTSDNDINYREILETNNNADFKRVSNKPFNEFVRSNLPFNQFMELIEK